MQEPGQSGRSSLGGGGVDVVVVVLGGCRGGLLVTALVLSQQMEPLSERQVLVR